MSKSIDMTGWKMNEHGIYDSRWTIVEAAPDLIRANGKHIKMWRCVCECGNYGIIDGVNLRSGASKSCGCLSRERARKTLYKHGHAGERIYYEWTRMKARCYNKHTYNYCDYGGRGIAMCDEWRDSFESFLEWANSSGYKDNLSLDRIDVNGNYEPSNCRWATPKEQSNNRRNNIFIEIDGEKKTLKQWCEFYGVDYKLVHARIKYRGWNPVDAILYRRQFC